MVQTQEPIVTTDADRYLILYVVVVLIIVSTLIIVFFVVFQRRKNKLLMDKIEQQRAFDEEIQKTQTEIQEQTLKHVASELHDNVGQLLVYASMQLKMISGDMPENVKQKVEETTNTVKQSLNEVRSLSKSLNNDVILNLGLEQSITNELNRLKKIKFDKAQLKVNGKREDFVNQKHEIVIFRILQEFMSNAAKYSGADTLTVELNYRPDKLTIIASDNGKGFDIETIEKGSGLINMKSRAELIDAKFNLSSKPNEGVVMVVEYPLMS